MRVLRLVRRGDSLRMTSDFFSQDDIQFLLAQDDIFNVMRASRGRGA